MILKTCSPEQDDWDENLKEIVFAYRSMVHSTTKLSPFQVMFGRKPIQKESDLLGNTEEFSESQIESAVNNLTKLRQSIKKTVKENVSSSQEKQKLRYVTRKNANKNQNSRDKSFHVGDKVLVFNSRKANRKGSKLEKDWLGPYVLKDITPKGVASLSNISGKDVKTKQNVKNIKKYIHRKEQDDCIVMSDEEGGINQQFMPVDRRWQQEQIETLECSLSIKSFHPIQISQKKLENPSNIVTMKEDGNCFFRSIAYALTGSESQHTKVRDFVVQWMTENSSKIESTFGKDYLIQSGMTDDGVWATEAEILATAAALNTDIFIFCKVGKLNKWLNHSAIALGSPILNDDRKCIYLDNSSGNHFNYVAG
jgi:regulator of replication initiation timing